VWSNGAAIAFKGIFVRLRSIGFAVFVVLVAAVAFAQSPSDGRVEGGTYTNSFFRLVYALPPNFHAQTQAEMNLPTRSPRGVEFFLLAARQGDDPYGIVMIAEKTRALTSNPRDFQNAADMIARVKRSFDPSLPVKQLGEKHLTTASGLVIDEFDYVIADEYSSAFVVTLDGYLITARCNARSAADLKTMTDSLMAMRRTK
jgi:hypothetical protein